MPNIISRADAEALIQEQLISTIQQDAPKSSIFMSMARKLPNMTSKTIRMPVLDMLPAAYWVNGDTGYKGVTGAGWDNVYINAAELAVIVPIPEAVLDDASFDILGEIQPRIVEAIGKRVDEAAIFGIGKPAEWPLDIVSRARQAGHNVAPGSNPDYFNLIMGENGVIAKVEESGHMVTGVLSGVSMRAKLRGLRTTDGVPLFTTSMQGSTTYALDGSPMFFPTNGAFDPSVAQLVAGDFSQAVYAIRQDITVKILDQGVIQDPSTKEIIYNLAQQDMIALRVVFRMGWALPTFATAMDEGRERVPFAYLEPATAFTTRAVTVTINHGEAAVEGATVEVDGAIAKTDAAGKAVFNLRAGTYAIKARKAGMKTVTDEVVVAAAPVAKTLVI